MFTNYLKITIRNLRKNKLYAGINILGLTVGITCFLLIALFIQYETSYDTNHEKADRIYRVSQIQKGNDFRGTDRFAVSPYPLASAMEAQMPEVEKAVTMQIQSASLYNNDFVLKKQGLYGDAKLFEIFTIPVIKGVGGEAINDPGSILLTQKLADQLFPNQNPVGQTLKFNTGQIVTVKGIIENTPDNQHLSYEFITYLTNLEYFDENDVERWGSNNYRTYALLKEGADPKALASKFGILEEKIIASYQGMVNFEPTLFLQPLREIYLNTNVNFEIKAARSMTYIYLFASVALIILVLAAVNYMNLATSNSAQRAKEIGMRKVMGARKKQLIFQLLSESFLLTSISFVFAFAVTQLILPLFNDLLGITIPFALLDNASLLIGMVIVAFLIGVLSGLYPAVFLTSVSPAQVFRGNFLKNFRKGWSMRNGLVIGQFSTAVILAIGSIVVYQQLQYIQNKKLGFNREEIVFISYNDENINKKASLIKSEISKIPNIEKVALTTYLPLNLNSQGIVNSWEGNANQEQLFIYQNYVDEDVLDLFEMEIVEGQNLHPETPEDTLNYYLLNQSAVEKLGWKSPVGKQFRDGTVIGVVKDFHFQTFDLAIEPLFLTHRGKGYGDFANILMKVRVEDIDKTLAQIEKTWSEVASHYPFQYQFLDETFNQLYENETRLGKAFNIFTALSLFIACMGLFGLVSHSVLQRTKEIGIRKVLGASEFSIITILSADFLKWVFYAILIATPIAWYGMQKWLQNFAYHIEIQWWIFASAGVFAIGISFLTVSAQSIKAALANPIDSLRSE